MRLLHLSDTHFFCLKTLSLGTILNKRLIGLANWFLRRRRQTNYEPLDLLSKYVSSLKADAICVTGDLAHLGQRAEFLSAATWLKSLRKIAPVKIVPGNHDLYLPGCSADFIETLSDFFSLDKGGHSGEGDLEKLFPKVDIIYNVALIGLSSAYASGLYKASGRIGEAQLARFEKVLEETGRAGLFRVVLIHHPPIHGIVKERKALEDSDALMERVKSRGAELILFGHSHKRYMSTSCQCDNKPVLLGAPSITSIIDTKEKRAGFYLIDINKSGKNWLLEIKDYHLSQERKSFYADTQATFII